MKPVSEEKRRVRELQSEREDLEGEIEAYRKKGYSTYGLEDELRKVNDDLWVALGDLDKYERGGAHEL